MILPLMLCKIAPHWQIEYPRHKAKCIAVQSRGTEKYCYFIHRNWKLRTDNLLASENFHISLHAKQNIFRVFSLLQGEAWKIRWKTFVFKIKKFNYGSRVGKEFDDMEFVFLVVKKNQIKFDMEKSVNLELKFCQNFNDQNFLEKFWKTLSFLNLKYLNF